MGLISRIQGILLANAHHTIDRAENPEVIVKQVIRSLDQEVQNARVSVVKAVTSEKQLAAQVNRHRSVAEDLQRVHLPLPICYRGWANGWPFLMTGVAGIQTLERNPQPAPVK